jgi:enoyl-CoA hydratase
MAASETRQVALERRGRVALVTITNPPRGYMDPRTLKELFATVTEIGEDDGIGAVVFTGGLPDVFIRHFDVSQILKSSDRLTAEKFRLRDGFVPHRSLIDALFALIGEIPQVSICAINGFCQGGGFEMALCCDLRYAAPGDYRIGLPEANLGIFPGAGGTQRLPRLIGRAKATELILRGLTLEPAEAAEAGLVHGLAEDVVGHALGIAEEIAARPARNNSYMRRLLRHTADGDLQSGLDAERTWMYDVLVDEETRTLLRRFLETGEDINDVG